MEPLLIMWIRAAGIRVALSSDEIGRPIKKKEVKREKKKKTEKKKFRKEREKFIFKIFFLCAIKVKGRMDETNFGQFEDGHKK